MHRCGRSRSERLACTPYQTTNTDAEVSVAISTRDQLIVEPKRLFLLKHPIIFYRDPTPTLRSFHLLLYIAYTQHTFLQRVRVCQSMREAIYLILRETGRN